MAKNKIGLEFEGFKELMAKFDRLGGDTEKTVEKMLKKSQEHVARKLKVDMMKHHRTGKTEGSIVDDNKVEWHGFAAETGIGFDLKNHGMPSIFLMYGTPRMKKDSKLYNDVYGKKTKNEIAELQKQIYDEEFTKIFGE